MVYFTEGAREKAQFVTLMKHKYVYFKEKSN